MEHLVFLSRDALRKEVVRLNVLSISEAKKLNKQRLIEAIKNNHSNNQPSLLFHLDRMDVLIIKSQRLFKVCILCVKVWIECTERNFYETNLQKTICVAFRVHQNDQQQTGGSKITDKLNNRCFCGAISWKMEKQINNKNNERIEKQEKEPNLHWIYCDLDLLITSQIKTLTFFANPDFVINSSNWIKVFDVLCSLPRVHNHQFKRKKRNKFKKQLDW